MISLILAIISSALVSIMMRLGETRSQSRMGLLLANYSACTLLGLGFSLGGGTPEGPGLSFALGLGIFAGCLFLVSLMVFQSSVARNGIVMSSTFMKLGVLVPTLMAVLVFRERPGIPQILGFMLAVCAILMLHFEQETGSTVSSKWLLLFLLLAGGGADAVTNVYDKLGAPAWKDWFLVLVFFSALVFTLILLLRRGEKPGKWDLLCGLGVGVPNYFSSRFTLAALKTVPAVVVFPVYSVATILVITLAGRFVFGEKLSRRKLGALLVIFAALILLNLKLSSN